MEPLIALNKNVAETLFGWKPGRPTISRRIGGAISRVTGVTPETGTDLFHLGLVAATVASVAALAKKR
jgi:hypothetical protein